MGVNRMLTDQSFIENYPFLHISNCDIKDSAVAGRFKMIVRYLKNLKNDSEELINISSYDLTGLMYHQPNYELLSTPLAPLALSVAAERFLKDAIENKQFQASAKVPNSTRLLFSEGGLRLDEVKKLLHQVAMVNYNSTASYKPLDVFRRYTFEEAFKKAS